MIKGFIWGSDIRAAIEVARLRYCGQGVRVEVPEQTSQVEANIAPVHGTVGSGKGRVRKAYSGRKYWHE